MKSTFTKSEQDVIDAMNSIRPLPKIGVSGYGRRYKRHDKAIESLKQKGLIAKDEKTNILQFTKCFKERNT